MANEPTALFVVTYHGPGPSDCFEHRGYVAAGMAGIVCDQFAETMKAIKAEAAKKKAELAASDAAPAT